MIDYIFCKFLWRIRHSEEIRRIFELGSEQLRVFENLEHKKTACYRTDGFYQTFLNSIVKRIPLLSSIAVNL